jgi:DNA-binding NarL/FixJ family response regulator
LKRRVSFVIDNASEGRGQQVALDLRGFLERVTGSIADLEAVSDEIEKVRELILTAINSKGQDGTGKTLIEVADRIEKCIGTWIHQERDEFKSMGKEIGVRRSLPEKTDDDEPMLAKENHDVLLVDDRNLFRGALRNTLRKAGFAVADEATTLDGAEETLRRLAPDLVIIHVCPEEPGQLGRIAAFRRAHPSLKMLVLTERSDGEFFSRLICSQAEGYILDNCRASAFIYAAEKILAGKSYLSPGISATLVGRWKTGESNGRQPTLTPREEEVLKLVAQGKSSKSIAETLFISRHTVIRHRANIAAKLNLRTPAALVVYAISQGYITPHGGTPV